MSDAPKRDYLEGSRFVAAVRLLKKRTLGFFGKMEERIARHPVSKKLRSEWEETPLRCLGVLLISAVLTNFLLTLMLRKPLGPLGLSWRGALFLIGILSTLCPGDWKTVREGSALLRFLFPREPR